MTFAFLWCSGTKPASEPHLTRGLGSQVSQHEHLLQLKWLLTILQEGATLETNPLLWERSTQPVFPLGKQIILEQIIRSGVECHWFAMDGYAMWKICVLRIRCFVYHWEAHPSGGLWEVQYLRGWDILVSQLMITLQLRLIKGRGGQHWLHYLHVYLRGFGWFCAWHSRHSINVYDCLSSHQYLHEMLLAIYPVLRWAAIWPLAQAPHLSPILTCSQLLPLEPGLVSDKILLIC